MRLFILFLTLMAVGCSSIPTAQVEEVDSFLVAGVVEVVDAPDGSVTWVRLLTQEGEYFDTLDSNNGFSFSIITDREDVNLYIYVGDMFQVYDNLALPINRNLEYKFGYIEVVE